jgi:uncharacterized damage-inducible protein DinB
MSIGASFLPEFDQEAANTRKTLARIPDDKFTYKPHPKSMDMGGLGLHIAMMTGWAADTMKNPSFDVDPLDGPKYEMPVVKNQAELLALYDKNVVACRAAIAEGTDAAYMQMWSLLAKGQPIFSMPRVAVIRGMIMNHLIHHRGQLTVYLRLNDIPVPALYGPSADEQS